MAANASLQYASLQYSNVLCLHTIDLYFNLIIYGLGTGKIYKSMDIKSLARAAHPGSSEQEYSHDNAGIMHDMSYAVYYIQSG